MAYSRIARSTAARHMGQEASAPPHCMHVYAWPHGTSTQSRAAAKQITHSVSSERRSAVAAAAAAAVAAAAAAAGGGLCEAIQTHNHPVLWLTFKRAVLNLCGLYVVVVLLLVASALAVHTTARL